MSTDNSTDLDFDLDDTESVEAEQVNDGDTEGTEGTEGTGPEIEPTDEEKAAAEAAAKAKADAEEADYQAKLTHFKELADGALTHEGRDHATGKVPDGYLSEIRTAYVELPGARGKAAARDFLIEQMQTKMAEGASNVDAFFEARVYMNLSNEVKGAKSPAGSGSVAKAKVDPTTAFAERAAALMLSVNLLAVPEDVKPEWVQKANDLVGADGVTEQVEAYKAWLALVPKEGEDRPEAPKVNEVVVNAAKVANGRVGAPRKPSTGGTGTSQPRNSSPGGPRRDVGKHIEEALAGVASGTFVPISEIAKFKSTEYGTDTPSQGAIAARLFPKSGNMTLTFLRPEGPDQGRAVKGAVKL